MVEFKRLFTGIGVAALLAASVTSQAATTPIYTQNFEGFPLGAGLSLCTTASALCYVNRSTTVGDNWGGGNSNIFAAQSGTAGSYIADSYLAGGLTGIVSDWLLSPVVTVGNGYTFSFYTKGDDQSAAFPDRLQVRLSTSGTSVNVGTAATDVGVFTTLLLSVNATLAPAGFPTTWTQYTATVAGLSGLTTGRFALRYFLDDVTSQGDYIGVDSLVITAVPEPETLAMLALGLAAMGVNLRRRSRG